MRHRHRIAYEYQQVVKVQNFFLFLSFKYLFTFYWKGRIDLRRKGEPDSVVHSACGFKIPRLYAILCCFPDRKQGEGWEVVQLGQQCWILILAR